MLLGLRNFWVVAFVLVAVPEAESSTEILDSIQIDLFAKQKETHRPENKFMVTKGEEGRDKLGVWD